MEHKQDIQFDREELTIIKHAVNEYFTYCKDELEKARKSDIIDTCWLQAVVNEYNRVYNVNEKMKRI